ncbi:MAG: CPBP family intramembrane metalloprotease [Lachnospiraceae bacterium]|nr:CPBP family intramembrane metalloprotease [Lachnospiraceae bacterium]
MNYNTESKIWRVGGPLFVYLGIRYGVQLIYNLWIFYTEFNQWNIDAALNGLVYAENVVNTGKSYALEMCGVAAVLTIPVLLYLMKKDYEYPINPRRKEDTFVWKKYVSRVEIKWMPALIVTGICAAIGLSRLILMLPIDGILGDYSATLEAYGMSSFWIQLVVLGVVTPIVEELLFRGLVYKRLKIYYEASIAAYISAIIFAVAHFNLIQGIYAFIMGIIFAFIHEKYKTVLAPIVVHMAANVMSVLSGINPISQFIDKYWIIRLLIGLLFTSILVMSVMYHYKSRDKDEN